MKSLYGLKQAERCWHEKLNLPDTSMEGFSFAGVGGMGLVMSVGAEAGILDVGGAGLGDSEGCAEGSRGLVVDKGGTDRVQEERLVLKSS